MIGQAARRAGSSTRSAPATSAAARYCATSEPGPQRTCVEPGAAQHAGTAAGPWSASGTTCVADRIAHGGFVVARHEGVVVFVRHALPGERVVAEVTEGQEGDRFLRGRRGRGARGLAATGSRRPARSPARALRRLRLPARRPRRPARPQGRGRRRAAAAAGRARRRRRGRGGPGRRRGLGWRTRVQWAVDPRRAGRAAQAPLPRRRAGRPLPDRAPGPAGRHRHRVAGRHGGRGDRLPDRPAAAAGHDRATAATFADGPLRARTSRPRAGPGRSPARASGRCTPAPPTRSWRPCSRRWRPQPGERAVDLYAGVGLFAACAGRARSGPTGHVRRRRVRRGAPSRTPPANLADLPQVVAGRATGWTGRSRGRSRRRATSSSSTRRAPAPSGDVVAGIARAAPRAVAYVACDPAALARDVAFFAEHGYALTVAAGVRPVPDDAPRRVRRAARCRPPIVYLDIKRH